MLKIRSTHQVKTRRRDQQDSATAEKTPIKIGLLGLMLRDTDTHGKNKNMKEEEEEEEEEKEEEEEE